MTLSKPNRVRGAQAWAYGLRLADGGVVTFSVQRDDGAAIQGIRASAYRTTSLARRMGVRDLPGYQHAALVAIRAFEQDEG